MNEITGNDDNQGIAILVKKPDLLNYDNLKKNINNLGRVVVILDHIMDTHNLGAIRTGQDYFLESKHLSYQINEQLHHLPWFS